MLCQECGRENANDARYCEFCGVRLQLQFGTLPILGKIIFCVVALVAMFIGSVLTERLFDIFL